MSIQPRLGGVFQEIEDLEKIWTGRTSARFLGPLSPCGRHDSSGLILINSTKAARLLAQDLDPVPPFFGSLISSE